MKKKTLTLTIIFLISIFMFNSKVNAAKEMTCVYNGNKNQDAVMFIQNKDGKQEFYCITDTKERSNATANSTYWKDCTSGKKMDIEIVPKDTKFDACPKGVTHSSKGRGLIDGGGTYLEFTLCEDEDNWICNNTGLKLTSETYSVTKPNTSNTTELEFYSYQDYSETIKSTKWKAKCAYKNFDLYFNDETMLINSKEEGAMTYEVKFSRNELLKYIERNKNKCPARLFYIKASNFQVYLTNEENGKSAGRHELVLIGDETKYYEGTTNNEPQKEKINSCKDLFSDTFRAKILQFLNIIKIAVPIMLIALGTVDFAKAVFSGNADEMKKSQKTFIKRLIASVLVFLVPVFVNLILTLANKVWSYISPEACIDVEEE